MPPQIAAAAQVFQFKPIILAKVSSVLNNAFAFFEAFPVFSKMSDRPSLAFNIT